MSSAAQQSYQQSVSPAVEKAMSNSELLDTILNTNDPTVKQKQMTQWLDNNHESIELLLPDFMKGQGERLARRAMITLARNPDLQDVPPREFIRCVLEAAEYGFAIDGKMAYVVKYGGKSQSYSCQFDYKALIAVAKRTGQIHSCDYDVVCSRDHFKHGRQNGVSVLEHTYDLRVPRGEVIGAYARFWHRDGTWTYELMQREELDKIQAQAPAQNGPWKGHPNEMRKKTVIKRGLKRYREEPQLSRMLEVDDTEFDRDPTASVDSPILDQVIENTQPLPTSRSKQIASQAKRPEREPELPSQDEPQDSSPNGDGELSDFECAKQDLENAPHPLALQTVYEKWCNPEADNSLTEDERMELGRLREAKLLTYTKEPRKAKKEQQGGLPLNP